MGDIEALAHPSEVFTSPIGVAPQSKSIGMQEITDEEYHYFVRAHEKIVIEETEIGLAGSPKIFKIQPKDFRLETNSVWNFPRRGDWATHYLNAKYRGNWAPQVARNLILRYSRENEIVLDSFCGSGTTLIECKLTGRNGIGVDINKEAAMLTRDRLNFNSIDPDFAKTTQKTYVGDTRNLNLLPDCSIDLIATHPPYANIISYTQRREGGDLSSSGSIDGFVCEMEKIAKEFLRVLKPGKYCAILMGDTRRKKHQVPISFLVMQAFLSAGFLLKESIIKIQHNTKTAPMWAKLSVKSNFLLLAHEHLFIFRKPELGE